MLARLRIESGAKRAFASRRCTYISTDRKFKMKFSLTLSLVVSDPLMLLMRNSNEREIDAAKATDRAKTSLHEPSNPSRQICDVIWSTKLFSGIASYSETSSEPSVALSTSGASASSAFGYSCNAQWCQISTLKITVELLQLLTNHSSCLHRTVGSA